MSSQVVTLEFPYFEEIALHGARELTNSNLGKKKYLTILTGIFFVVLGSAEILYIYIWGPAISWLVMSAITLACGLFILLTPWLAYRRTRQDIMASPNLGKEMKWTISSEGLRFQGEESSGYVSWRLVQKVEARQEGYLVFPQRKWAFWLPKEQFESDRDVELFESLVKSSGSTIV